MLFWALCNIHYHLYLYLPYGSLITRGCNVMNSLVRLAH